MEQSTLDPPDEGYVCPTKTNPPELGGKRGGSEGEGSLAELLGDYGSRKRRSAAVARYLQESGQDELAHKLNRCAFAMLWQQPVDADRRLIAAKFCHQPLLCPNCAYRRGLRHFARLLERLQFLAPQYDAHVVTLTVRNGYDLRERVDHLIQSWRRYRERARDHLRGRGPYVELARVAGGTWSVEVTRNPATRQWHPHMHAIWLLARGAPPIAWGEHSRLAEDWHDVTGDSYIVHAQPAIDDTPAAVAEVMKYALKFADLSVPDTVSAWEVLRRRRLVESFGALYGVQLPEYEPLTDPPEDALSSYHLAAWSRRLGAYRVMWEGCEPPPDGLLWRYLGTDWGSNGGEAR